MTWPFLFRATHEARMAELAGARDLAVFKAAQAEAQADYWRRRAELFLDRAAAKAGITHEPVMRGPSEVPIDPFAMNPFGGFSLTEFDSTATDGKARN